MVHAQKKAQDVSSMVGPVLIPGEAAEKGAPLAQEFQRQVPKRLNREKCHTQTMTRRQMESPGPSSSASGKKRTDSTNSLS